MLPLANIGYFYFSAAKVPTLGTYLAAASAAGGNQLVQAVIYDLPDRDCAAEASAGEFSLTNNGSALYMQYIDNIAALVDRESPSIAFLFLNQCSQFHSKFLSEYPDVRVVFVVEPDSLANLVTNLSVQKCSEAETAYKTLIGYAISKLQQPNVFLYLDAGHSGWLGWPANITPAAQLFASVLQGAGAGAVVRGLATG